MGESNRMSKPFTNTSPVNKAEASKNQTASQVQVDLRGARDIRNIAHYALKDINYAGGYDYGKSFNSATDNGKKCVKMLIIEKQTKLPVYTEDLGEATFNFMKDVLSLGGVISKASLGQTVTAGGSTAIQVLAKAGLNKLVSSQSDKATASTRYQKTEHLDVFTNMFATETSGGIISYEVPFFSDYWMEVDGESGWRRPGAEMTLGKSLGSIAASLANINFPNTPDWEYTPQYPRVDFEFHLINDTTENLRKNLMWLSSILPGMMYVQLSATEGILQNDGKGSRLMNTMKDAINKLTSFYKSPNVYEIMVPGRFRWLWSTMSMDVKCVGKIFADNVKTGVAGFDFSGVGFPEAFKLSVSLNSLVPQAFNTYAYFLNTESPITGTTTQTEIDSTKILNDIKDVADKIPGDVLEASGDVLKALPTPGDFFKWVFGNY